MPKSPYFTEELSTGMLLKLCMDIEAAFSILDGQKLEAADPHEIKYLAPDGDVILHATKTEERLYSVRFHKEVFHPNKEAPANG